MTHCMYCGMAAPPKTKNFKAWECPECNNIICSACLKDLKSVNKTPICIVWSCVSTRDIVEFSPSLSLFRRFVLKVKSLLKTAWELISPDYHVPIMPPEIDNLNDLMTATYESNYASAMKGEFAWDSDEGMTMDNSDIHSLDRIEGAAETYDNNAIEASKTIQDVVSKIKATDKAVKTLEGKNTFVEINDGHQWINVICQSFDVQVDNSPFTAFPRGGEKRVFMGRQTVKGLFEIILSESVNYGDMKYIRAYTKENGHKTTFKGVISSFHTNMDPESPYEGGVLCTIEAEQAEIEVLTDDKPTKDYKDWGDSYIDRNKGMT